MKAKKENGTHRYEGKKPRGKRDKMLHKDEKGREDQKIKYR